MPRIHRQCRPDDCRVLSQYRSGGSRIRDGEDEPHRSLQAPPKCEALELAASQLRLEVAQPSLDLNVNGVLGLCQDQVGRSQVRRRSHRHLEEHFPSWMCLRPNRFCKLHLSRVTEARPLRR